MKALVAKWRKEAAEDARHGVEHSIGGPDREYFGGVNQAVAKAQCADELDALLASPAPEVVVDTETGIKYQVLGRRMIQDTEWVDLALVNDRVEPRLARSVSVGLFNRIFVDGAQPAPATPEKVNAVMLAALHEVAHHADDEFGFMVNVRAAIALASQPAPEKTKVEEILGQQLMDRVKHIRELEAEIEQLKSGQQHVSEFMAVQDSEPAPATGEATRRLDR